jgi:hypothetical protein
MSAEASSSDGLNHIKDDCKICHRYLRDTRSVSLAEAAKVFQRMPQAGRREIFKKAIAAKEAHKKLLEKTPIQRPQVQSPPPKPLAQTPKVTQVIYKKPSPLKATSRPERQGKEEEMGSKLYSLNIPQKDLALLKKVAKEEGESVSTLIRMAIKKHLKERAEG